MAGTDMTDAGGYAAMPTVAAYPSTTGNHMMVRYGSQGAVQFHVVS